MATITFSGNLAADPELRFTPSGRAVARFTVIENKRTQNEAGEWEDGEPNVFRCEAWRNLAEHIADSAQKGDRVTVIGHVVTERWNDKETGDARTAQKVTAEEVAVSLKFHTVRATKSTKTSDAEAEAESDN